MLGNAEGQVGDLLLTFGVNGYMLELRKVTVEDFQKRIRQYPLPVELLQSAARLGSCFGSAVGQEHPDSLAEVVAQVGRIRLCIVSEQILEHRDTHSGEWKLGWGHEHCRGHTLLS